MTHTPKLNIAYFLTLACLWSGSFIGIKAAVDHWPPIFSAMMRVAIATITIFIIIKFLRKKVSVPFNLRWKIWMIGLFAQAIPFSFLFWGESIISPGLAGIINGTVSIWTFILSLIFFPTTTHFSLLKSLGLAVGLFGVAIIFWPALTFDTSLLTLAGTLAVFIMAISYAIGNVLNQYFLQGKIRIDFFTNLFHQHCASVVFLLLETAFLNAWPSSAQLQAQIPWLASIYLGVFSTALAFVMYYHLIREWDGVRASTIMYIVPALTLIWDALIFDNKPSVIEISGVITILIGVVLIQLSSLKLGSKKFNKMVADIEK